MPLQLVPPATPDLLQAVAERVKKMRKREPGTIQCTRCGGRSIMTVVNNAWIDPDGKLHRGTVIDDRVCYDCHRAGIFSPMFKTLPKLVQPKRTKPKAVK